MTLYSPDANQRASIYSPDFDPNNNPMTVGVLYRNTMFVSSYLWLTYQAANFNHRHAYFDGNFYGYYTDSVGGFGTGTEVWRWYVVTTAASSGTQRYHYAEYAASGALTWTHGDFTGNVSTQTAIDRMCIGDPFGSGARGSWMALAGWNREMSDAEVEATFLRSSQQIVNHAPDFFAHWPEAVGVAFEDIAGGGTEKVSEQTGTWQVTADPTGYDPAITEFTTFDRLDTPAGTLGTYDDGTNIRVGNVFYCAASGLDADAQDLWVTGARLFWVGADGDSFLELYSGFSGAYPTIDDLTLHQTSQTIAVTSGWNEVYFDTPWKIPGNGIPWMIVARGVLDPTNPQLYLASNNTKSTAAVERWANGAFLSADNDNDGQGTTWNHSHYKYDGQAAVSGASFWWGLDTIITNVPPGAPSGNPLYVKTAAGLKNVTAKYRKTASGLVVVNDVLVK